MLHIHLRFYEELNAFIPQDLRKKRFTHTLKVHTSAKDLIESFNVPHTQVNMILVNSEQADFCHIIKDQDDVSVFPYFHRFDIDGITKITHPKPYIIRFITDNHLGKLVLDLRMLGFDTHFNKSITQSELVSCANHQERIVLTKNRNILKRKDLKYGYYIYEDNADEQLAEVILQYDLFDEVNPFSRCLVCNSLMEPINKKLVLDRLPPKVKQKHTTFTYCPTCDKIYWKGTHYKKMKQRIEDILTAKTLIQKNTKNAKI